MPGKCKFNDSWLRNPHYSTWIEKSKISNGEARCKLCVKSFDIQNMGEAALKSHMKSKRNTTALQGEF